MQYVSPHVEAYSIIELSEETDIPDMNYKAENIHKNRSKINQALFGDWNPFNISFHRTRAQVQAPDESSTLPV